MSKSTISTFHMFPDEAKARLYLETRLWPKGTTCPTCAGRDRITARKRPGFYRCNKCQLDFIRQTGEKAGMIRLEKFAAKKGMTVAEFIAAQNARRERRDDNLRREVEKFERIMGFDAPLSPSEGKRL